MFFFYKNQMIENSYLSLIDVVSRYKWFSFGNEEIDFYLPQLVNMYITMHPVAEVLHPYLVARCRSVLHIPRLQPGKRHFLYMAAAFPILRSGIFDFGSGMSDLWSNIFDFRSCISVFLGRRCHASPKIKMPLPKTELPLPRPEMLLHGCWPFSSYSPFALCMYVCTMYTYSVVWMALIFG